MRHYQGIVFDFNGVLLMDGELQAESWQDIARELRGYGMSENELSLHMHGRPNGYVLSYLAGREILGDELANLIQRKESHYRALCLKNPRLFVLSPGAIELLSWLCDHGIPRTIATSSEKTNVEFFIEHLRLARWFDTKIIVFDNGVRPGKPAPDIYWEAARDIGVAPQNCIVVEDAIAGIASAYAAGIGYIIGIGPKTGHPKLQAYPGVARAMESLEQFPMNLLDG